MLGDGILYTVIVFFLLVFLIRSLFLKYYPKIGSGECGRVQTAGIDVIDFLGVGAVICFVALLWKAQEVQIGKNFPEMQASEALLGALTFLGFAAIIPASMFWRVRLTEFFGLRWMRFYDLWWIIPLFIVVIIGATQLTIFLGWNDWAQQYGATKQNTVRVLSETNDVPLIAVMVLTAVIAAPLAEEVIFRGYLYPVIKHFTERNFAALFTAVLFGVAHCNLLGLPVLIFIGVLLVVVYEWTGSLWAPIACHMAFNSLQVTLILVANAET